MPDKNLFCSRNQKHRTENTHLNSDISEDEFVKDKRKIRFLISLDNNGSLKTFPIHIRSKICFYINQLLNDKKSIKNIIVDIFSGIRNKSQWILEIKDKDLNKLILKMDIKEYIIAFEEHFKKLVNVVQFLRENPSLSLAKVSKNFSLHKSLISEIAKSIFSEKEFYERYLKRSAHSGKEKDFILLLKQILDRKKIEILDLEFIPTKENLFCEENKLKLMEEQRLQNNVRYWLEKNTEYTGVWEMIRTKENKISISIDLYNFLDNHKNEILSGNFVPNRRNLSKVDW